ncbi:MAG: DNA/RNA nuclease SfsA [Desulfobacca sp.]|nr:DNA/RNA nuclease SfsA [Desulfobacca sp.]
MHFFNHIEPAYFLDRPNRFVVCCLKGQEEIRAFLPNPGRLQELLFPGSRLVLTREHPSKHRKYPYTVVAVEREGLPIMLHTHMNNVVARYLIDKGKVPGLETARVIGKEIRVGHSRFDFLLENQGQKVLMEVKSCTLVGDQIAMFPDAVTERGSRHLRELAELSGKGQRTAVLWVVHWPKAKHFLPDYHTDLLFARTMLACRDQIRFFPVSVRWQADLSLASRVRRLPIPWDTLKKEAHDQGSYLLILRLAEQKILEIGKLGKRFFPGGYYVYIGSAMANLTARMARHRRLRKTLHWHIDYLRAQAEFQAVLPVRSSDSLECQIAEKMKGVAHWTMPGFGSSDCSCPTHLFGMESNPFYSREFISLVQYFRMDRLNL